MENYWKEDCMAFIELRGIDYFIKNSKDNKTKLFENLDLSIESNEFIALIGDNGVGKTTLSKLIIGQTTADKGTVRIEGNEISKYKLFEIGDRIGYLFQDCELQLFCNTIEEELLFKHEFGDGITEEAYNKYSDIVRALSLETVLKTPINKLSTGEKKRVAIGTILMNNPKFIILDEPTAGLDSKLIEDFRSIIIELNSKNIGILLITHNMNFVDSLPSKIYKLTAGGLLNEC